MALISTAPWVDETPSAYEYNWLFVGAGLFRTRTPVQTLTRRWTCDKDGGTIQSSPGTGYEIALSNFVRDPRFLLIGLPTAANVPAGQWVEVWQKIGSMEIWNGSAWVAP